jgi:hypothetical protein
LLSAGLDEAATRRSTHRQPHDILYEITPSFMRGDFAQLREDKPAWTQHYQHTLNGSTGVI